MGKLLKDLLVQPILISPASRFSGQFFKRLKRACYGLCVLLNPHKRLENSLSINVSIYLNVMNFPQNFRN